MGIKSYRYPLDLGGKDYDNTRCVSFLSIKSLEMFKKDGDGISQLSSIKEGDAEALIYLPTPLNLNDTQSHSWSQETVVSAFEKISQAIGGGLTKAATGFGVLGNAAGTILSTVTNALVSGTTNAFTISANLGKAPVVGLMSLVSGQRKALVNPGYFQNYTNSTPRTFEFSYTFYSRNQEEALEVLNIIRSFKMYSSPSSDDDDELKNQYNNTAKAIDNDMDNKESSTERSLTTNDQTNNTTNENNEGDILNKTAGFANIVNTSISKIFGYMGQPNYWRISFGNNYLNKLLNLDYVVCTNVGVTYGNGSKLEMYKDGIPKVITLSLSFAEVKLKMREDFSEEFTKNTNKNNTNYSKYVSSDNSIKATIKSAVETAKSILPTQN